MTILKIMIKMQLPIFNFHNLEFKNVHHIVIAIII